MIETHDPIAVLVHEHDIIKKVAAALSELASSAERAVQADPATLREVVRFMREFADRCHHAKEEKILFPAMVAKGVPDSGCPVAGLIQEHQRGRALVSAFAEAVEALAGGAPGAPANVARAVGELVDFYGKHIWKEDEMVFPMVQRLFSAPERHDLFEKFEKAEEEIGADHESLAAFANRLQHSVGSR